MTAWTRKQLATRVDELAAEHEGAGFVAAVERFAAELGDDDRERLGEVLVARAGAEGGFEYGLARRIDEPRWQLFSPRPREPKAGRDQEGVEDK